MGFVWGSLSRTSWFCVLLMLANGACAKTFDCARQPKGKDGFTTAEFRLWVPESVPKLRGVLVLLPGWQGDGRGMADDSAWQAFAEGEGFALLGCHFKSEGAARYDVTDKGSGAALLAALEELAATAHHPELAQAPLALWGHSAGGQFAYSFAGWKPDRTVAFVAVKGGVYVNDPGSAIKTVPALLCAGQEDKDFRIDAIKGIYSEQRKRNAPWCLLVESGAGHELGRTHELARPFLKEAIRLRLPEGEAAAGAAQKLRPVPVDQGWLIDPATGNAEAYSRFSKSKSKAIWVPTEALATLWKQLSGSN